MPQLLIWALLAGAAPAHGVEADLCGGLARTAERREGIPAGLVQAVALAESGRWVEASRASQTWPWTVRSGQDAHYLPSRAAALAKVRELKAHGRTNIDVGCMQLNLGYHGHAFGSVEEALDPAANVAYGAGFLKRLRAETGSWSLATAYYHNRDPARGEAYRARVFRLWHALRPDLPGAGQTVQLAGGRTGGKEAGEQGGIHSFGAHGGSRKANGVLILRGR